MLLAVADTHTLIWYLDSMPKLSATAKLFIDNAALAGDQIGISAITLIEVVYLIEKGRITTPAFNTLIGELANQGSVFVELPVDAKIAVALQHVDRKQIPDMPDRIIAATALSHGVPLISRDRKIKLSTINTIW